MMETKNSSLPSAVAEIVEKAKRGEYPIGKTPLAEGMLVNMQAYTTKFRSEAKYEAHKRMVDIQLILDGQEIISVAPITALTAAGEYNDVKDVIFYQNNVDGVDYVLRSGDYLVLYPEDGHQPGICVDGKSEVKKAVIKVPVELMK